MAMAVDTEWLAYLTGEQDGNVIVIDGMYFPDQRVTGAHCEAVDGYELRPRTIGTVHSHVRMAAFWSQEDKAHWNHPAEIVINARGESKAVIYSKLDCGRMSRVDAKIQVTGRKELLDELKAAIGNGKDGRRLPAEESCLSPYGGDFVAG
jgi:hypothetical protein